MQGIGRYADKVSTATCYLFLANCHTCISFLKQEEFFHGGV